ncbi:MAG: biotin transporter BioY [Oscillospiraceae bacterium]|nr:biotin transporter BioY [Oscillospiraceae bacterium]
MKNQNEKTLSTRGMVLCAMFTALIAIGAFLRIHLPISPVPYTMQFLFVNLAGILLGSRRGFLAVGLYIILGLVGVPVFSTGGGFDYIFRPTFGYILGFALGAWLAGLVSEHGTNTIKTYLLAGFVNFTAIFALGLIYCYFISNYYLATPIGVKKLLLTGFLYFVPIDAFLVIISAILAKRLHPMLYIGKAKV